MHLIIFFIIISINNIIIILNYYQVVEIEFLLYYFKVKRSIYTVFKKYGYSYYASIARMPRFIWDTV